MDNSDPGGKCPILCRACYLLCRSVDNVRARFQLGARSFGAGRQKEPLLARLTPLH